MEKADIDTLELSVRSMNCLVDAGIRTIDVLCQYSERDLRRIKNFGSKSLKEIQDVLAERHLALSKRGIGKDAMLRHVAAHKDNILRDNLQRRLADMDRQIQNRLELVKQYQSDIAKMEAVKLVISDVLDGRYDDGKTEKDYVDV